MQPRHFRESIQHPSGFTHTVGAVVIFLLVLTSGRAGAQQLLHGHVPKAAARLQPLRQLEDTNVLQLAIGLPLRNQDELTSFLQDVYDPSSPHYRHFITPQEFTTRFGPTEQDYQAVMEFAKTNGFKVVGTHPNRMLLDVVAAVPKVEKAFHLNMRVYRHPTEAREFYAPDAEPQIDLAAPVLHISGLDNFLIPRPLYREMSAAAAPAQTPSPAAGSGSSGNYAGKDFHAAYAPGVTNTGAGQSVGLLEFQGYYASDITAYETAYGIPNVPLNNVLLGGLASITADASDAECPLDIEMAISMATNLTSVVIYCTTRSGNTDTILNQMATDNSCKQLSASWLIGADATGLQIYQQMASQGQSFFNASGDSDAASSTAPLGEDAPYVTMVGGTTLVTSGPGGTRSSEAAWNRGNGTGSTGGVSPTYSIPLWQQGISMTANQGSVFMRNAPDVACVAENVWVLYNNGGSGAFGGTSCAAPLWAGYMALVNQQAVINGRPNIGFINPAIYTIGKSANYASDFHDITSGNNASTTSAGRFNAVTGYDLATGWGTPSGLSLMNALVQGVGDTLTVTPTNGLSMAGPAGGPFIPASGIFTLANYAGMTNKWSLINTSAWFTVSSSSGTLLSGATANVTVTVATAANSLSAGYYTANLLFTNLTTSAVQNRPLILTVGAGLVWDSSAGGGTPQDGPGTWADPSSSAGNTNWWNGATDILWSNSIPEIATFGANSGAADVVTLGGPITAVGINFTTPGSGNYTIASGGNTLTLNGNISANASATITAPLTLGAATVFTVASSQTLAVSSVIAGVVSNTLSLNGPGTVSLTGQNNTGAAAGMAGAVTVNSGTLALDSSSLFGALGNVAGITIGSGAVMSLQGANAISGSSGAGRSVTINNGGSVTNAGTSNHALGLLTLNGGTMTGTGSSSLGSFNLTGDVFVYSNSVISAQNLTTTSGKSINVASGKTLTLSGKIIGTGGLTCGGPGTVILGTNNSYSGNTVINYGAVQLLASNGLGLASSTVTVGDTAQLQLFTNMTGSQPLTLNGSGPSSAGALRVSSAANVVWTGTVALGSPTTITLDSGTTLAFSNIISGANSLTKSGAGTLNLYATNTFTGNLNVDTASTTANDGILRLASSGAAPSGVAAIQILDNNTGSSTLQLDGSGGNIGITAPFFVNCRGNTVATIESLAGTNTIGGIIWLNVGGNMFNIQCDAGRLVFSGTNEYVGSLTGGRTYAFSGAGDFLVSGPILNSTNAAPISLTKAGAGTLTLGATNSYASGTTLSGGTLLVNGLIIGTLTVASSTTLGGKGAISSAVTIPSGATLAPGTNPTSIATLTVSNSVTLQSGSTTRMKISHTPLTNDVLRMVTSSGGLTCGGSLVVTNLAGTLAAGDSFKLFNGTVTGSFVSSNLPTLTTGLLWNTSSLISSGTLNIIAIDFGIAVTPFASAVQIGSNTSYTVTITASNGFTGSVGLSVSGLPTGASASFSPASVTGSGTATLTIVTSNNIAAGNYPLTITGTNADFSRTHTAAAQLNVTDFSIGVTPASQSVFAGKGTNFTVNVAAINGFNGTVALNVSGLPAGANYTLSQTNVSGSGTVTVNVTTTELVPTNNYLLTVSGTSGSLTHSAQMTLAVQHLAANLVWYSTTNGNWDIATSANWIDTNTEAIAYFYQGDTVVFTDIPGVTNNIVLGAGVVVQPAGVTVYGNIDNYIISGAGKISGTTALSKYGSVTFTLGTTNDFTGNTTIGVGTLALINGGSLASPTIQISAAGLLDVSGRVDGTLTLNGGQTLQGNGAVNGSVTVNSGATLVPGGNANGTLSISNNLTLAAGSTNFMEINATLQTNDVVLVAGNLTYGGTLIVTNLAGSPAAGNSFQLFNAGNLAGNFSALVLPPLTSSLAWNTNSLTNGVLAVANPVSTVPTNIVFSVSGTNLSLSWPMDHTGWRLLVQTGSMANGLSSNTNDWMTVSGSPLTNQIIVPVDPTLPLEFYRLISP